MHIEPKTSKKLQFSFPLMLLVIAGCATTSKDFKPSSVHENEGAIFGHVKVKYNGQEYTAHCTACFNSVNGPCLKLDQSGLVAMKIAAGEASLRRIACLDTSIYHYNIEGAKFEVAPRSETFFGDVSIDWTTGGGLKTSAMFGLVGVAVDESSNDGTLVMSVSDQSDEADKAYRSLAGEETRLLPKRSIVPVGK